MSGLQNILNKAKKLLSESKSSFDNYLPQTMTVFANEAEKEKRSWPESDFLYETAEQKIVKKQANLISLNTTYLKENVCTEHKNLIQHQKEKIDCLTIQLGKTKKEVRHLQSQLTAQQTHASDTRAETERQASLIASLTSDAAVKDAMLHQLDSAIGRLTTGWQSRESQLQNEVTKTRQADKEHEQALEKLQQEYQRDRQNWQEQMLELKSELNALVVTNQQENARHKDAVEAAEQHNMTLQRRGEDLERVFAEREVEIMNINGLLEHEKHTNELLLSQNSQLKAEYETNLKETQRQHKREVKQWQSEKKRFQEMLTQISNESQEKIRFVRQTLMEEYERRLHKVTTEKDVDFQLQFTLLQEAGQEKLREASERYRQEIEHLRRTAQSEMTRQVEDADVQLLAERSRAKTIERQVERWRSAAREAEEARSKLAQQMNQLLQARCVEAMQVLNGRPEKNMDSLRLLPEVAQIADRLPVVVTRSPSDMPTALCGPGHLEVCGRKQMPGCRIWTRLERSDMHPCVSDATTVITNSPASRHNSRYVEADSLEHRKD